MPRPDHSRKQLVAATARLLQRQGYAATSVADILRTSGATSGSLYHHFPGGKEQVATAALRASAAVVEGELLRAMHSGYRVAEAVQGWVAGRARELDGDPSAGCPVAPTALEAAHASEALRSEADRAFTRWSEVLRDALVAEGRGVAEAEATATMVLAAVEGALLLSRTAGTADALWSLSERIPTLLGVAPTV